MADFVIGANEDDHHYTGANVGRDFPQPEVFDIRNVVAGDPSPDGKGTLELCRGIEVGHIFQLRTKYSSAMNLAFLDESGKSRIMEMGCYGIGVTRVVAAAIEQNHDAQGIIWPIPLAPFPAVVVPVNRADEAVWSTAQRIHDELSGRGIDAVLDDRDERPGVKFKDADLIGFPLRVVVGPKALARGNVELKARRADKAEEVPVGEVAARVADQVVKA
jgi:prolyl-tRNA synthetase